MRDQDGVSAVHTTDKVISVLLKAGPRLLLAAAVLASLPLAITSGNAGATQPATANLLSGDTATLQSSVGSWVGSGANIARSGVGVLSLTATSTGLVGALSGAGPTAVPATADRVYAGSFSVKSARYV